MPDGSISSAGELLTHHSVTSNRTADDIPRMRDGLDLIWSTTNLRDQLGKAEQKVSQLQGGNLTDTEKAFEMQVALNSWSLIVQLATNQLKVIAEAVKGIARNLN